MKRHSFPLPSLLALIGLVLAPLAVAQATTSPDPLATLQYPTDWVSAVAFAPDGTLLASGGGGWNHDEGASTPLLLWNVASRRPEATFYEEATVAALSFSPDGTLLATGGQKWDEDEREWGYVVLLWDVASRKNIATIKGHTNLVYSVAFAPDGTLLATAGLDETIRLWDVATRDSIATLQGHASPVYSVTFSPDGATLASAAHDSTIKLWDVATRDSIATLQGHTGQVYSVAFAPDGATLASAAHDSTIKLWDVATRDSIATLQGHTGRVAAVSFSPAGTTLASAAADATIKLWDVASRENIATLQGHTDQVISLSFSPAAPLLASAAADATIRLWDVSEWIDEPTTAAEEEASEPQAWLTPDPAEVAFSADDPAWKTFTVHTSLDSVLVHANPSGSDPAIEVEGGNRPPTREYCPAEGNDRPRRGRQNGWNLHVKACQAGQTKILLKDYATGAVVQQYEINVEAATGTLATTRLNPSYPNPFNSETVLSYRLPTASDIRLEVFTLNGQRVAILHEGFQAAGYHAVALDASALASGVYLYRLTTPAGRFVQKFTLLR